MSKALVKQANIVDNLSTQ